MSPGNSDSVRIARLEEQLKGLAADLLEMRQEERRTRTRLHELETYVSTTKAAEAALSAVKAERAALASQTISSEFEQRARRDRRTIAALGFLITFAVALSDRL